MLKELFERKLIEAKEARKLLAKEHCEVVGAADGVEAGWYLSNYSTCLLNRQIDIFDDTILLLDNDRLPSACVISRGMIETYAFARHLGNLVSATLGKHEGEGGVDKSLDVVLRFTNSSRIKETEQRKVSKGIFEVGDYRFTQQALARMTNQLATSEHVMSALRSLYSEELKGSQEKESQFEFLYDILSEWVHPSQTSVFHNYVPSTHVVPTSHGTAHLYDAGRLHCVRALHFITDSENVHQWLLALASELTARSGKLRFS